MNFGYDSLIGISAALLTTLSFLPQIVKAYRTRRMKDVSRYLMILFTTGSILWIIYGIIHDDLVHCRCKRYCCDIQLGPSLL
jgi:MtN3 and saliva related transmembrane protein